MEHEEKHTYTQWGAREREREKKRNNEYAKEIFV